MARHRLQPTTVALPYVQLPALYHRWKWRVLLVYAGFYLFQYMGRFNLSQVAPLVMQDLQIDHHTIGWVTALLYWGFMAGYLVHGRLGEIYGLRLWVMLGAVLTTTCNWLASLSMSALTLALPWCINGFVNAACWSPGISLLAQWWPRRERGQALGIVGMAAGGAQHLHGFGPYKRLLSNPQFLLASQVKGLENVVRYGLTTWIPLYYFEASGLQLKSTLLFTH